MVTISNQCLNDWIPERIDTNWYAVKIRHCLKVIKPDIPFHKTCLWHFISLGEGGSWRRHWKENSTSVFPFFLFSVWCSHSMHDWLSRFRDQIVVMDKSHGRGCVYICGRECVFFCLSRRNGSTFWVDWHIFLTTVFGSLLSGYLCSYSS